MRVPNAYRHTLHDEVEDEEECAGKNSRPCRTNIQDASAFYFSKSLCLAPKKVLTIAFSFSMHQVVFVFRLYAAAVTYVLSSESFSTLELAVYLFMSHVFYYFILFALPFLFSLSLSLSVHLTPHCRHFINVRKNSAALRFHSFSLARDTKTPIFIWEKSFPLVCSRPNFSHFSSKYVTFIAPCTHCTMFQQH